LVLVEPSNAVANAKRFFLREARGSPATACGAVAWKYRFDFKPDGAPQLERRTALLAEGAMRVGDYPVSGKPYWLTMTGVAALEIVRVVLMLAVQ